MARHYLDHASTSPARPEVIEAMVGWLTATADPGRVHTEGHQARAAVEDARRHVAALLGARPREVVFTSGAPEATLAAFWGAAGRIPHSVVVSAVEHSSVRAAADLFEVTTVVGVDPLGRVTVDEVIDAVDPDRTGLVSIQYANHEVGTVQPVAEIVAACRERAPAALVHVDAAAAAGHVPISFDGLGVDLMTVSADQFGGPQGVGALLVRRGLRLRPLLGGGDQERGRRAGTENVAGIVGFGAAAALLGGDGNGNGNLGQEAARAAAQTARLAEAALAVPGVVAYGDPDNRLPHIVCLGVSGVEAEGVLLGLDQRGVAAHSGSACSSESLEPSPVLAAMGVDAERSLRLSTGWSTVDADVAAFGAAFPLVVATLRSLAAPA